MTAKKENVIIPAMKESLNYIICPISENPDDSTIDSVYVFPNNSQAEIMMIKNERGWDIPGGHVENGESLEKALERETWEEASISIYTPTPFVSARIPGRSKKNKAMLFYHAEINQIFPFTGEYETTERKLVPRPQILEIYSGGNKDLMEAILAYLPEENLQQE